MDLPSHTVTSGALRITTSAPFQTLDNALLLGCRICGKFPFQDLPCPGQAAPTPGQCYFPVEPNQTYYWDDMCQLGMVGCWADSYHSQCRFCGGTGDYASVPCPDDL